MVSLRCCTRSFLTWLKPQSREQISERRLRRNDSMRGCVIFSRLYTYILIFHNRSFLQGTHRRKMLLLQTAMLKGHAGSRCSWRYSYPMSGSHKDSLSDLCIPLWASVRQCAPWLTNVIFLTFDFIRKIAGCIRKKNIQLFLPSTGYSCGCWENSTVWTSICRMHPAYGGYFGLAWFLTIVIF